MAMMMIKNHVRSISLPSRSHPSTAAIEETIDKLLITMNTTMTSSESVYSGLAGLEDLYDCTEDFLKMSSTQSVLSFNDEKKKKIKGEFMEEMLGGSLRLMDICNVSRDLMVETHEHVLGLQSCVRRKKDVDVDVSGYVGFRKNMKKEVKKLLISLKNINVGLVMRAHVRGQDSDFHLLAVIHAMRRVVSMTGSVLKSFLEFLSGRQNGNDLKIKLALVLMNKQLDHDKVVKNELENLDSAICGDSISLEDLHMKLEKVEVWIGRFENSLEGLFRGLIRTRASLLNIISQ
ncbi:hypothetical protein V5N11_026039 [Cardamine amara subsp. amara]|uniref:Uncharacterized protein n=1 Tax=Cardamine amara subsp. amara TaxID=228776 RepID=A0ABD1C7Y3_CARAN